MSKIDDDPIIGQFFDTNEKKVKWIIRLKIGYIIWIIFMILGFSFFLIKFFFR